MKIIIYCAIFLLPILGHSEVQKILDITAESDADLLSYISIDVNGNAAVESLVYQPDAHEKSLEKFSTQQLIDDRVTLKSQKGFEVIGISLKQINPTAYAVTLHYLYKFRLFNRTYKDKQLNVSFSTPDNRYLVQDDETKKMISRLHFVSNYNETGKEVGIEKIETL
ncbi:MAG: hypothetical protein H7Z71_03800 [Moraxellaceae bacterium]|nr:hypothetical protein [Pseudobdellovibrionaceae bacterium]